MGCGGTIHGRARPLSASSILEAAGEALDAIRSEDRLKWSELGHVFGKSEDQAAKYADASAEMGLVAYTFARAKWGSRFTGILDRMVQHAAPHVTCGQTQHRILEAALAIEHARETQGDISLDELRDNRSTLENARDAIDAQLSRLAPNGGTE